MNVSLKRDRQYILREKRKGERKREKRKRAYSTSFEKHATERNQIFDRRCSFMKKRGMRT